MASYRILFSISNEGSSYSILIIDGISSKPPEILFDNLLSSSVSYLIEWLRAEQKIVSDPGYDAYYDSSSIIRSYLTGIYTLSRLDTTSSLLRGI